MAGEGGRTSPSVTTLISTVAASAAAAVITIPWIFFLVIPACVTHLQQKSIQVLPHEEISCSDFGACTTETTVATTSSNTESFLDMGEGENNRYKIGEAPKSPTEEQRRLTSREEFRDLLANDCPAFGQELVDGPCQRPHNSCAGRCRGADFSRQRTCKCDPLCQVFGDCCWDFTKFCHSEVKEYQTSFSHFPQLQVSCMNGKQIIVGCGPLHNDTSTLDMSLPYVTDMNGLTFANIDLYRCAYSNAHPHPHANVTATDEILAEISPVAAWNKLLFPKNEGELENIHSIFLDGWPWEKARARGFHFWNVPGMLFKTRECLKVSQIVCTKETKNKTSCGSIDSLKLSKSDMCWAASSLYRRDVAGTRDEDVTTQIAGGHSSHSWRENTTTGEIVTQHLPECRTVRAWYNDIPYGLYIGQILVEYDSLLRPQFILKSAGTLWKWWNGLRCENETAVGPCNLKAICKKGYMPVGFQCMKPLHAEVIVLGYGKIEFLNETLSNITALLEDKFGAFLSSSPERNSRNDSQKIPDQLGVGKRLYFRQGNMPEYIYRPKLPVTDAVIGLLNSNRAAVAYVYPFQVVICFTFEQPEDGSLDRLLCDGLVVTLHGVTLRNHSQLHGPEILGQFFTSLAIGVVPPVKAGFPSVVQGVAGWSKLGLLLLLLLLL